MVILDFIQRILLVTLFDDIFHGFPLLSSVRVGRRGIRHQSTQPHLCGLPIELRDKIYPGNVYR